MGRVLIAFNRRDDIFKLDVSANDLKEGLLDEFLGQRLNIPTGSFKVEILDSVSGHYVDFETEHGTQITKRGIHKIMIIETDSPAGCQTLAIAGRLFDMTVGIKIGTSHTLRIEERDQAELGTGLVSWDSSVLLAKYLEKNSEMVVCKSILEVGAGTGIAGIAANLLGARNVVLTDLPYVMDNLKQNIALNCEKSDGTAGGS